MQYSGADLETFERWDRDPIYWDIVLNIQGQE